MTADLHIGSVVAVLWHDDSLHAYEIWLQTQCE